MAQAPRTVRELSVAADLGLSQYQLRDWFSDCELKGDALVVPTDKAGSDIDRLFGHQLRAVLPGLKILVSPPGVERPKSPILKRSAPQELHDLFSRTPPAKTGEDR